MPSPKVATYDLKPEMSAIEVAREVAAAISTQQYPFVMCNFAPPDMVRVLYIIYIFLLSTGG